MKKLLALLMAMALVLALGVAAVATINDNAEPYEEDPATYLYVSNDDDAENDTVVTWKIAGEKFLAYESADWSVRTAVKFEDITGEGSVSMTLTFWDNEDLEIDSFVVAEDTEVTDEQWYDYSTDGIFVNLEGYENLAYATLSIAFDGKNGTMYVATTSISANKEVQWSRDWADEFDLEDEELDLANCVNVSEEDIGIYIQTEYLRKDNVGTNLAAQEGASVKVLMADGSLRETNDPLAVQGQYNGCLNDGKIAPNELSSGWYGFHANTGSSVAGAIDDVNGNLNTLVIDLGEEAEFNRVRLWFWARSGYGVSYPVAIRAYYSNDMETWETYADLLFEDLSAEEATSYIGWADTGVKEAQSARYVKVEYLTGNGAWHMVSEVEVISTTAAPDESSEVIDETSDEVTSDEVTSDDVSVDDNSSVEDTSSETSGTPGTSDNGIVALAVIASLAVAGAFIAKKSR